MFCEEVPVPFQLGQQVHHIYGLLSVSKLNDVQRKAMESDLNDQEYHVLALTDVADVLIPFEFLSYFSGVQDRLAFVRFFKCCFQEDRYVALLFFRTLNDLFATFDLYQDRTLSSLLDLRCEFHWIHSVSLVRRLPSDTMAEDEEEFIDLHSVFSLIEGYSLIIPQPKSGTEVAEEHDEICTICLDKLQLTVVQSCLLDAPKKEKEDVPSQKETHCTSSTDCLVVLHCSHVFHYSCLVNVPNSSCCPVCRFQHDSSTTNNVKINVFCTICQSPGQSITSKTDALYSSSKSSSSKATLTAAGTQPRGNTQTSSSATFTDLWLCITCGFIGCGESCNAHSYQHFLDTKHTYIMNVADQNVWDYSGGGYVYRIALESNPLEQNAEVRVHTKISEVTNGSFHQQNYRSSSESFSAGEVPEVPLSSASLMLPSLAEGLYEEKLGNLHQQYQNILQWRLEQNKLFYQQRLKSIWRSVGDNTETFDSIRHINSSVSEGSVDSDQAWIEHIKVSLQLEKMKLWKQLQVLKDKADRVSKEQDVNRALEGHLTRNKAILENKIQEMKKNMEETKINFQNSITTLESKVGQLMQQLDSTSSSAKSTSFREKDSGGMDTENG